MRRCQPWERLSADNSEIMAKGYDENQARVATIASFGKDLARRSRSRCELCEATGVKLTTFEVAPVPKEPSIDHCLFLCDDCREQVEYPKRFQSGERWRCLTQTLWSEVPVVQVMAVRLLRKLSGSQAWAQEALENAFLEPEIEEWAAKPE